MVLKKIISLCLLTLLIGIATACVDNTRFDVPVVGDGEARLHISVGYDYEEAEIRTRGQAQYGGGDAGDIIRNVETLWMAVYDENGDLLRRYRVIGDDGSHDPDVENVVNSDDSDNRLDSEKGDSDTPGLGDSRTGRVDFEISLLSGRYYIYAIANVDNFESFDISTREKLKNLSFSWDETTTKNNSQMFGVFTVGEPNRNATDANHIIVPATAATLHAWVRRLASKVTVAFDGTELYDNVQVYVTDIAIKDIPRQCKLGVSNRAGLLPDGTMADRSKRHDSSFANSVIATGKKITVQEIDEAKKRILPANYYHICKQTHPYLGIGDEGGMDNPDIIDTYHTPEARSLFFFENNQGVGKPKQQIKPGSSTEIWYPNPSESEQGSGWKDNIDYGTYVEVTGHYRCTANNAHVSAGTIKYRFMLGQNDSTDYNATRNTHYKLTLKLKGFGNDYDWHVDYVQKPGLQSSSPHFISYLYNKQMYITVKYQGKFPEGCYLTGEVDDSTSWKPWGDGSDLFPAVKPGEDFYGGTVNNDGPWNAFLSLQQSNIVKLIDPDYVGKTTPVTSTYNHTFWEKNPMRGKRVYNPNVTSEGSNEVGGDGRYNVTTNRDKNGNVIETIFTIPLFTRAKELVKELGFTGNNPYWEFPRHGVVNFYVSDASGNRKWGYDPISVDVVQVRRILNPKGVWRRSGSTEPFHVTLMHHRKGNEDYQKFVSQGPWSAELMTKSDPIITLSTTTEGSGSQLPQRGVTRIEGANEHPIDFNINFNGTDGCAVIRVRYHNYTCEHDIFVREGYDPIDISGKGNVEWDAFNVLRFESDGTAVMTTNPLQEGSLFRREVNIGIAAANNNRSGFMFEDHVNGSFWVYNPGSSNYNSNPKTWDEIKLNTTQVDKSSWKITNPGRHIASGDDYYELITIDDNDLTFPINKAYGVVYGDGATETQSKLELAEGYNDENGGDSQKGMRGVIVYNVNTKKQIFFPIGYSGHGHRKHSGGWRNSDPAGTLRYAGRSKAYSATDAANAHYVPLFEDLYKRPGAIYWCRDWERGTKRDAQSSAIDFNFFTFGLSGYLNDAANDPWTDSHACFIRTVKEIKKK